ncbi:phosphonate C-P lyase system protein PhnH [Saliterribacillus persicus]|uniref:Alpha-D-ribose 1-methylphosphonate 5-triphosphate synthase subunit PhnH n=1 Tax=Saliterribacillus persicus TaxID=930114 RepID=A0A368XPA4_9BACI|nr:phosphonate C-P lyase system protein PhnH [Saliterribacillus persicus]RCW69685.1 alpha-D-ribose 1-methylphosphonate 5-triphosphate synthase subunit PhnH [Saliterribacillus persicus]
MAIDQVHDLQQVYRNMLDCMARPGTITSLEQKTGLFEDQLSYNEAIFLCALTVLDAEVTFYIIADTDKGDKLAELISSYTMARVTSIEKADFIIVLQGDIKEEINKALSICKMGDLINPQQSATWIVETAALSNNGGVTIHGPGIKESKQLQTGLWNEFWQTRNSKVKEYPLGIDLIFVDALNQISCVPRTTSVKLTEVG